MDLTAQRSVDGQSTDSHQANLDIIYRWLTMLCFCNSSQVADMSSVRFIFDPLNELCAEKLSADPLSGTRDVRL
jgi:hypothetical protein